MADDGENCWVEFVPGIPYEPSDLFGDLERQVRDEWSKQTHKVVVHGYPILISKAIECAGWNKQTREVAA